MTTTIPQEPGTQRDEPEPAAAPPTSAQDPKPKQPAVAPTATPQEPVATSNRRELPPDFDEKMMRMFKARADVLQTPRPDDRGRVVREPIADPDEAMLASAEYFVKFIQGDGVADEMHAYLAGGPMPKYWVPSNTPTKSRETLSAEQMAAWREENPVKSFAVDYVLGPAAEIVPAFGQVFADTYVGLANWFGAETKSPDVKAAVHAAASGTSMDEARERLNALEATRAHGFIDNSLHCAGKLGGELPAYLAGGGIGVAGKAAGAVTKGNVLLQAAKATVLAPGTVMRAGGAIGAKIGAKVAGKTGIAVAETLGRGAGAFGALGGVQKAAEVGRRPTALEAAKGVAIGAAQGVVVTASSEFAKAAFRGMFRSTYKSLGKTEQEAMDALKKWGDANGIFPRAGDTQTGFVNSLTTKWVDAGMPGAPKMAVKKLLGYAVQGSIESTGFSALDYEFWSEHGEAVLRGDAEALKELGAKLAGGALALGAFHIPLRDIPAAQRRSRAEPQGEAPKPAAPEVKPEAPREAPQEPRGGIAGEPVVTRMEGEPAPQAIDPGTLRTVPEPGKRDPATGTILTPPAPLAQFGWREVFPEPLPEGAPIGIVPGTTEGGGIAPTQAGSRIVELPGTTHSYTITGETAEANPSLASVLGVSEPMPVKAMEGLIEHASLLSALASKSLPGTEIDASGVKAVGTDGVKDGVQRTVRLGEVLEASLSPDPKWKSVSGFVPKRGKDHLEPDQQMVVAGLKDMLTKAENLPEGDRAMLSGIVDVLDTVAARNDQSIAETLAALPKLLETLGNAPSPEQMSLAIKAAAEMLTTKVPEQALADMKAALLHGSPSYLATLRAGSMLTDQPVLAAGYTTKIIDGMPAKGERFVGAIHEVDWRPTNPAPAVSGGAHGAENALLAYERQFGLRDVKGGLQGLAKAVHEKTGYDAIVSKDKAGKIDGMIPLVDVPVSKRRDPVDELKAAEARGEDIPDNLKDALRRRGEAGFIDIGAAAEPAKKGFAWIGERITETFDAVFRDQIRSIEKRGGDPEFAAEMRRVASESRDSIGKVLDTLSAAEPLVHENQAAMMQMVDVNGVVKPRWDALLHRQIEPANAAEKQVADVMNEALLQLWEIARQSGVFLSKPGTTPEGTPTTVFFERSAGRTQAKLPRVWAEGKADIYEDPAARKRWFEKLAELHPGLSAEALEKSYLSEISATEIKAADRDSAIEHVRHLENVPYEFEGKQMLERDPFEAFRRIVAEEASRAATIREVGQEGVPPKQQAEVRARLGLNPLAKGVSERIERWFKTLPKQRDEFKKQAVATMTRLQGKEPAPLGRGLDKVRRAQGIRRAAMTMLSGLRDIPSMFTEGANWGGLKKMAEAFDAVARNYPVERQRAERLGTLLREIGNLNLHEAADPLDKAADWLGEFGGAPGIKNIAPRATERFRTVMMSKVADLVLKDWAEGTGRDGATQILKELDFNPKDSVALIDGSAPDALQNQFRRQLVQRAMSRGRASERSRFAASPLVQSLVDFTGYASKRFYGLAREAKTAVEAFKPGSDATLADKAAIAKRLMTRVTGLVAGGMLGDLLYYIVADAIEGKDGWNHYMRDLLSYPGQTITKGAASGVLSGPLAVLFRAASGRPEAAAQLTVVTSLVQGAMAAAHDATTPKGWLESVYDIVASTGVIPQPSRLKSLAGYVSGAALGENTEFRDDAKLVSQFRQQEGIVLPQPTFDKQAAFYSALGQIRDFIDKADMKLPPEAAAKQIRQKADAAIKQALALQPEENVAAAVRGMQHAENIDKQKLMDYVRDEKRFERMMMHDQMVSELAEAIGREQGTNPTPFEERLAGAAKIAAGKAQNAWNKLASDTIEDAAVARLHGQPTGTALRDLANRMSLHRDSVLVDGTLGDSDKKLWARLSTQGQRQRFLEGVFRDRVFSTIERMRERDRR